jgi:hypothetical protein
MPDNDCLFLRLGDYFAARRSTDMTDGADAGPDGISDADTDGQAGFSQDLASDHASDRAAESS